MPTRIRPLLMLAAAAALLLAAVPSQAQSDRYVELLRQDIQSEKVALMTEAMDLDSAQGEIFWPLYRDYTNELSKLGDQRLALIKQFGENYGTMTDEVAADISKNWFKQEKDRLKLLEQTHKKVAKELGALVAARFVQVENQLTSLVSLQASMSLPFIE